MGSQSQTQLNDLHFHFTDQTMTTVMLLQITTGWGLKHKKFILSQFRRLEVWDQGVRWITLPLNVLRNNLSHDSFPHSGGCRPSFQLSYSCITPISASARSWSSSLWSLPPNLPLLIRMSANGFRNQLIPIWLCLNLIISENNLFPIRSHSWFPGGN